MNTNEIETLSNTITSKQAIDLLDKSLEREEEDKCILKAIDHLERWEGKKVQREFNEEIGFEVTAMKEDTFEVVKAIRFEDSVIYQAPYYVKKYLERGNWIKTDDVTRYVITTYKLERVENPSEVKIRELKKMFKVERDGDFYYLGDYRREKKMNTTKIQYQRDYELYDTLRSAKHEDGTPKYEVSVDEKDIRQLNIKCIAAGQKEKIKEAIRANSPVWKRQPINSGVSEKEFTELLKVQRELILK